jgi:hypothetical protein
MLPLKIYGRRPLTRLEAGLYGGIAAILIAIFAGYVLDFMETAERVGMELTLSHLISGVNTRVAYDMLLGKTPEDLAGTRSNPFELARMTPTNFLGSGNSSSIGSLERGSWFYDVTREELVYLPRLRWGLETGASDKALRWHFARRNDGPGYVLILTTPYRWQ